MQQEQMKKKSVLGIRLSYLSKIPKVRDSIETQMQTKDLLVIMRPLIIEHEPQDVVIDVRDDEKEEFAPKLDTLAPGEELGRNYLDEDEVKQYDKRKKREHDWDWWEDAIAARPEVGDQLHAAVQAVLGHKAEVDAYGNYESPETAVHNHDSGKPQLDFWTTKRYTTDDIEKG